MLEEGLRLVMLALHTRSLSEILYTEPSGWVQTLLHTQIAKS